MSLGQANPARNSASAADRIKFFNSTRSFNVSIITRPEPM
jgi:hypothetical protein